MLLVVHVALRTRESSQNVGKISFLLREAVTKRTIIISCLQEQLCKEPARQNNHVAFRVLTSNTSSSKHATTLEQKVFLNVLSLLKSDVQRHLARLVKPTPLGYGLYRTNTVTVNANFDSHPLLPASYNLSPLKQ